MKPSGPIVATLADALAESRDHLGGEQQSNRLVDEFARYARDYEVRWAATAAEASVLAAEHERAGDRVALFVCEAELSDLPVSDALAGWRSTFPTARRVVLLLRDRQPGTGRRSWPTARRWSRTSPQTASTHCSSCRPAGGTRSSTQRSRSCSQTGTRTAGADNEWVQIVAEGDEPLTADLRDFLDRSGYPTRPTRRTAWSAARSCPRRARRDCRWCAHPSPAWCLPRPPWPTWPPASTVGPTRCPMMPWSIWSSSAPARPGLAAAVYGASEGLQTIALEMDAVGDKPARARASATTWASSGGSRGCGWPSEP